MNFPVFSHDSEYMGAKRLAPDISEQLEVAKRIDHFLQGVLIQGIEPLQKTRILKDYRSPQPGGGTAHVSVGYTDTQNGQYRSEIQTNHHPAGVHSHYSLLGNGESWLRNGKNIRGNSLTPTILDLEHMLEEMQDYAPERGEVASLQDKAITTRALVSALFDDMNRGAHYKAGSDQYRTTVAMFTSDGYASAKRIELIDGRVNNSIKRRLSISALVNLGLGVDVDQTLMYEVQITKGGTIRSDSIQLMHKSSDGLSPQALANLAESSDVVPRRFDIIHKALDDLSQDKLESAA